MRQTNLPFQEGPDEDEFDEARMTHARLSDLIGAEEDGLMLGLRRRTTSIIARQTMKAQ